MEVTNTFGNVLSMHRSCDIKSREHASCGRAALRIYTCVACFFVLRMDGRGMPDVA